VGTLLDGGPVTATSCTSSTLPPGQRRLLVEPSTQFDVAGLTWAAPRPEAVALVAPRVTSWTSTRRTVEVASSSVPRTLELAENANAGWIATVDGQELAPMRVDGWRQAWLVPAGVGGEVLISYRPDTLYRAVLVVGAAAAGILLVLVVMVLFRRRTTAAPAAEPDGAGRPRGRLLRLAAVVAGLLALGVAGVLGVLLGQRTTSRPRLRRAAAAAGVLVATAAAVVAPWPVGTTYSEAWQVGAALAASAGLGLVLGAVCPPAVRRVSGDAPSAEPDAPPAGT
jgi:arabinofuranan 3-O-arabinosyltransferase